MRCLLRYSAALAVVALAACGSSEEANKAAGEGPAASANSSTPTARTLPPEWYVDSDGNAVPDFVEASIDFNPRAEDCPINSCLDTADGTELRERHNTLLMLDSSGSMRASMGGQTKMEAAKASLMRFVPRITERTKLGFLVYGHKGNNQPAGKAESCVGIDILTPIGGLDKDSVGPTLARFQPVGWTPIAAALLKAREAFVGKDGQINRILLVSDGLETCGGDPVAVARELHESGLAVEINIVGFGVTRQDAAQLRQVAQVTGGSYAEASSAAQLEAYLNDQVAAVVQNRESMMCQFNNSVNGSVCDSRIGLAASTAINKARIGATREQTAELDALTDRLKQLRAERDKQRDASAAQLERSRNAYEKTRSDMGNTLMNRGP